MNHLTHFVVLKKILFIIPQCLLSSFTFALGSVHHRLKLCLILEGHILMGSTKAPPCRGGRDEAVMQSPYTRSLQRIHSSTTAFPLKTFPTVIITDADVPSFPTKSTNKL